MESRKILNRVVVSTLLLSLVSCGNEEKSKSGQQLNQGCAEMDCLSSINWKIQLHGKSFPEKSRIDINGTTVLNECVSKQKYMINRESSPQSLYLESFYIPKRGDLNIDVVDMGTDCHSESSFISDKNVEFELTKEMEVSELVINL